jgi:hypothetical protein
MSKLEICGVVARERRGHHVYFRLSAPWVKELLDARLSRRDGMEETVGRQG